MQCLVNDKACTIIDSFALSSLIITLFWFINYGINIFSANNSEGRAIYFDSAGVL